MGLSFIDTEGRRSDETISPSMRTSNRPAAAMAAGHCHCHRSGGGGPASSLSAAAVGGGPHRRRHRAGFAVWGRWRRCRGRFVRRRRPHRGLRLGSVRFPAEAAVVLRFLVRIEQACLGGGQFVENLLRQRRVLAQLVAPHMGHLPLGCVPDDFGIVLQRIEAQEPVVVWRLMFRWNAKPPVIRIELLRHGADFHH